MPSNRPSWLTRLFRTQKPTRPIRRAPRAALGMEYLEDRAVPATVITIQEAAGTLDGFLSATDGTINQTDLNGQAATLSRGALQGVNPGVQISITAQNAIAFDASLAGPVALQTNSTTNVQFLAGNGNLTFAAGKSITTAGADITFSSTNGVLTVGGVATSGGNIVLTGDALVLNAGAAVNAGQVANRSIVTVQPTTNTVNIDLGGADGAGVLGVSTTELGQFTARVLRAGNASMTGTIAVTAAATLAPAAVPTLSLITTNSTATAVTQTAALSVQNLAVQSVGTVVLQNGSNDVTNLAANVVGTTSSFSYKDATGVNLDTVDGVAGVTVSGATATNTIVLDAGGALTQAAGANVTGPLLQLLGTGPVTLTNTGNNVVTLAAALTGSGNALSYTDADALSIDTVNGTNGVSTTNGAIAVSTVNGALTVVNTAAATDVDAGTSTVSLTAGSTGAADNAVTVSASAAVNGTGGVTLVGDNIGLGAGATVTAGTAAGTSVVALKQFQNGTLIDLGGADGANTLGLTSAELDTITAGIIRVGDANSGNITVSAAITIAGANSNQLELVTGGAVVDNNATNPDFTVTRLAVTAATGIGATGTDAPDLETAVSNFEATTATGGVRVANTGALTIGGVSSLTGVSATTGTGIVSVTATGTLTVSEAVSGSGGGDIVLAATGATSNLTTTAAVSATGGNGVVNLNAHNNVNIGADVSAVGTGNVSAFADSDADNAGDFTSTAGTISTATGPVTLRGVNVTSGAAVTTTGGNVNLIAPNATATTAAVAVNAPITITGGTGAVNLTANSGVTVTAAVAITGGNTTGTITVNADADGATSAGGVFTNSGSGSLATAGGNISITASDASVGAAINATTGATSRVSFLGSTVGAVFHVGGTTAFGLTNAELQNVTAGTLQIGAASNTGGIVLDPASTGVAVNLLPANVPVLSLITGGAITETNPDGTDVAPTLSVQSLALQAGTGIGTVASDLDIAVTNLAAANSSATTGAINLTNSTATLNIGTVDGVVGVTNANANAATGPVTVTTTGALNVNQTVTAAGTGAVTLTAGGAVAVAANTTVQSGNSTAGGAIAISSNATVNGTAQPTGTADITLGAGAQILTRGNITLDAKPAGVGANFGGGIGLNPTAVLAGPGGTLATNISLNAGKDITVSALSATSTITVTTTKNIFDDAIETTALSANQILLTAGGVIGGQNIITPANVLAQTAAPGTTPFTGAIDFDLTGVTPALTVTQTAPGNVQLRKINSALLTSTVSVTAAQVGPTNQLALISSGGSLTIDSALTAPTNLDVLLATTGGNSIAFSAGGQVNNGTAGATTNLVASGSTSAAITDALSGDNTPEVTSTNGVLITTGGAIGAVGAPLEFNFGLLNGFTNGNAAATGGAAFLTDTANGLAVGQFSAAGTVAAGNVALASRGNNGSTTNLTAVTSNDNTAEIIGNVVTLDTSAAPSIAAPNGQIGSFSGTAQFFEVNANVLNASTNNSRLWISEVGAGATAGAQIGLVTAGTETVNLRVRNGGSLTSEPSDLNVADVVGATVNLTAPEGGNFGSAGSQLEIDATTLSATVTGTGVINIVDLAGGLTVQTASTTGDVSIVASGGALTLGNANSTGSVVTATGGTAALSATTTITSAAPATVVDVTATSLVLLGTNVGTVGTPIESVVSNLAAGATTLDLTNAGSLTVTTVNGTIGVGAAGNVNITTTGATAALSVSQPISAGVGNVNLTSGFSTSVNAAVSGASVAVGTGNGGALTSTTPGTITASNGAVQLTSSGAVSLGGTVGATAGNVTVQGAGLVSNTGTITTTTSGNVSLTATGGTNGVTVGGAVTSAGTVAVNAAGAANINAAVQGTGVTATGGTTLSTTATVTATGAGTVGLTASDGALTVGANVSAGGTVTLTATDTATTTNNVIVNAGATVSTTGATIAINAGDAATINGTLTTAAAGTVNVNVDAGAVDAGVGGTVTFAAASNVTGAATVNVTGGGDNDTFNLKPLTTGISTDVTGGVGTDTLNIALTGATTPTLGNITAFGDSTFTFANRGDVDLTSVESIAATGGTYAVNFGLATAGFQDANAGPDVTTVASTGTAVNISVQGNSTGAAQTLFTGRTTDVNAITLAGSTDRDTFNVDLATAGVPMLTVTGGNPTTAPGDTLNLVNTNVATGAAFTANGATGGTYSFTNRASITFSQIETLPKPIVRVVATQPNASEGAPATTGTYTFTRVGDLTNALTVGYGLGGTAVNGTAYQLLPGAVTFAAGSATATVTLTPLNNSVIDGFRTAVLTLTPSMTYDLATGQTVGTVIIADNDKVKTRAAVGSSNVGAGTLGTVAVFDNGVLTARFIPFPGYQGGVSVAVGDVTGDGVPDIIAASTDISSAVKVFDGATLAEIQSFFAFPGYNAGVTVAAGDLDNDGQAEVIVGTLLNNTAVSAFSFVGGARTTVFGNGNVFPNSGGGVSVAAGDTNGDGKAEIIVGARGGPAVKVFDIAGNTLGSFVVPNASGALNVGAGDIDGDGVAEILVGNAVTPAVGRVTVLTQGGGAKAQLDRATTPLFPAPTVGAADVNNDGKLDLLLGLPGVVSALDGNTLAALSSLIPFAGFQGGVFVG